MRDGPKAPKGKLYAKYHNVIRSLTSGGLIEKTKKFSKTNECWFFNQTLVNLQILQLFFNF